jgi:hypothetical protein
MDIDVGQIEQIKIWHDDTGVGSAWLLDSITIRKKHSTCLPITNIFIQRLEQISKALYRQARDQMKKAHPVRMSSANENDRRRSKLKDDEDSAYNRGILRSPIDKANAQKTVRWDEHSIGSQDEPFSTDTYKHKQTRIEQNRKKDSSSPPLIEAGHYDHQAYWVSTHNYSKNKWNIYSIEETNPFDLDQSVRTLLSSDRSTAKPTTRDKDDDVYEFQANRWLAKDKNDGKLEVHLTPKSMELSTHTKNEHRSKTLSDTVTDTKKKPPPSPSSSSDVRHNKYDQDEKQKRSERLSRDALEAPLNDLRSPRRILQQQEDPLNHLLSSPTQHSKPPRYTNDSKIISSSDRELLARISHEPPYHNHSAATSSIDARSSTLYNQHSKFDEPPSPSAMSRERLNKLGDSPFRPPSASRPTTQIPSDKTRRSKFNYSHNSSSFSYF